MPYAPKIDNTISIGSILSVLTMLGVVMAVFYDVKADVRDNTVVLMRLERIVISNTSNITDLRIGYGANLERTDAVKFQLTSLHDAFDKMEDRIEKVMTSMQTRQPH